MNRYLRFSGIACVACLLLTILALLLLTSSARAQLDVRGIGAFQLGFTRSQIDSVVATDVWGQATIGYDPTASTLDLLPESTSPRAHPQVECNTVVSPPRCSYIDRVKLNIVPTRSGESSLAEITVRMRAYGPQSDRAVEESLRLYNLLSEVFCSSTPCTSPAAPKAAKLTSALNAGRGGDTVRVGTWGWPTGAKEPLSSATLMLVRDKAAKLVWCEVVYKDMRKR